MKTIYVKVNDKKEGQITLFGETYKIVVVEEKLKKEK